MDLRMFNGSCCCLLGLIQRFPHQDVLLNRSMEDPGLLGNVGEGPVSWEGALQEVHLSQEENHTHSFTFCRGKMGGRRTSREPAPGCWKSLRFFHCQRFHKYRAAPPSGSSTETGIKTPPQLSTGVFPPTHTFCSLKEMFRSVGKVSVSPFCSDSGWPPGLVQESVAFSTTMANLWSFRCCRYGSGFWISSIFWKSHAHTCHISVWDCNLWQQWQASPPFYATLTWVFTFRRLIDTAASAIVFTVWGRRARLNLMALKMEMVVKAWQDSKINKTHTSACVYVTTILILLAK